MGTDVCLECRKPLTLYQSLRHAHFCSAAHWKDYLEECDARGIRRLAEARVRMGMESPAQAFPAIVDSSSGYIGAERRKRARIALDAPVRVTVPGDGDGVLSGRFVNASSDGVKITTSQALNVGVTVRVESGNHAIVGEVRRCQPAFEGYAIGIAISTWLENSGATSTSALNSEMALAAAE